MLLSALAQGHGDLCGAEGAAVPCEAEVWPKVIDKLRDVLKKSYHLQEGEIAKLRADLSGSLPCCLLKPEGETGVCSFSFVSLAFKELFGRRSYSPGIGLEILDLAAKCLNERLNRSESKVMDVFQASEALESLALFIHERGRGELFWDVLRFRRVVVSSGTYIFVIATPITNAPVPRLLIEASNDDELQPSCFIDRLGEFLYALRTHLRSGVQTDVQWLISNIGSSIASFMKTNTTEFEGDHWVPITGLESKYIFEHDIKWIGILSQVKNMLFQIYEKSADDQVACAVSDPCGEDCPLVYISAEFEKMTGYTREWVLGRNCRFLQPNHRWRNVELNQEECLRMRAFCKEPQAEHSRIVNLLVNESKDGYPFWNLLVMEHIMIPVDPATSVGNVSQRPYIFGVQTKLADHVFILAELLAMDELGLQHLRRLRQLFWDMEGNLRVQSLSVYAKTVISVWMSEVSANLALPRYQFMRSPGRAGPHVPVVGLEVVSSQLGQEFPSALQEGIRHFYLSVGTDRKSISDPRLAEPEMNLLALHLADTLAAARRNFLHYLHNGIGFTLLCPPQCVSFAGIVLRSALSSGYTIDCFMLDLRMTDDHRPATLAMIRESWKTMETYWESGAVTSLGLCGASAEIYFKLDSQRPKVPIAAFASSLYVGKQSTDCRELSLMKQLYASKVALIAFNVFGPGQCLLKEIVDGQSFGANGPDVDPALLLVLWAKVRVNAMILPRLWGNQGRDAAANLAGDAGRVEPSSLPAQKQTQGDSLAMHRTFVKALASASKMSSIELGQLISGWNVSWSTDTDWFDPETGTSPWASLFARRNTIAGRRSSNSEPERRASKADAFEVGLPESARERQRSSARRSRPSNFFLEGEPFIPTEPPSLKLFELSPTYTSENDGSTRASEGEADTPTGSPNKSEMDYGRYYAEHSAHSATNPRQYFSESAADAPRRVNVWDMITKPRGSAFSSEAHQRFYWKRQSIGLGDRAPAAKPEATPRGSRAPAGAQDWCGSFLQGPDDDSGSGQTALESRARATLPSVQLPTLPRTARETRLSG